MAGVEFESVTIRGFKSIRDITNLALRPINLVVGANGSGKTNFLEAFVFLGEADAGNVESYVQYYGGASRLLHYGAKSTQKIAISLQKSNGSPIAADYDFVDGDRLAGKVSWYSFPKKEPTFNRYRFQDTGEQSPLKKTDFIDNNRSFSRLGGNLAPYLYLLKQMHPESYRLISETVRQVAPFFREFILEPLALNPNVIKLEWRHKYSDEYYDASSFSDGTLRFIALATLFLQPVEMRASVILIDEPELGLHPYAIELLAAMIRRASLDTQVIAATQSPLLLDYFDPEDILIADRDNGATTIHRLEAEPLTDWLKDYSLGQLWEKGEFAGRPVKE